MSRLALIPLLFYGIGGPEALAAANCREAPINMAQIEKLADSSKDMLDFLKKIPPNSLQSFTFVTNSLSLHRGKKDANGEGMVSPLWPRVLRGTVDGKITISFVCDPRNPSHGKVEIFHFDDNEKEFKTTEIDFGPPNAPVSPGDRIHQNPGKCISCHAGSVINGKQYIKPNWQQYFMWTDCKSDRGVNLYGGNDDNMATELRERGGIGAAADCTPEEDIKFVLKQRVDYLNFRKKQANNDCFNTLPWPKSDPKRPNYSKFYPYAENPMQIGSDGYNDYTTRTNLRFTDVYSHLLAQQIGAQLRKNPAYERVKYFLTMEQAGCLSDADKERVKKLLPAMKWDSEKRLGLTTSLVYNYSLYAGLGPKDWTMEMREMKDPTYFTGIPASREGGDDQFLHDLVGGEILKEIGQSNKRMAELARKNLTTGVTEQFGPDFSCIDKLGGGIKVQPEGANSPVCKALVEENNKHLARIGAEKANAFLEYQKDCEESLPTTNADVKAFALEMQKILASLDAKSIKRGRDLINNPEKSKCAQCHSPSADQLPADYRFIATEKDKYFFDSKQLLVRRMQEAGSEGLFAKLGHRLISEKSMPPIENSLTDQDREDIKSYLLSLTKDAQ